MRRVQCRMCTVWSMFDLEYNVQMHRKYVLYTSVFVIQCVCICVHNICICILYI